MTHHPGECIEHYMGLHDSLFEAGRYDMLTDIYSGMFLYMPSDPDGNPDTLRRQLLRIMPLYNQVLSKTGAYEAAVQLLDSIRTPVSDGILCLSSLGFRSAEQFDDG